MIKYKKPVKGCKSKIRKFRNKYWRATPVHKRRAKLTANSHGLKD
jgi:hypothetical protein